MVPNLRGVSPNALLDQSQADICSNVKSSLEVQNFLEYYIGDGEINSPESLLDSVQLSGISHFGITACLAIPELRGLVIGIYFLVFRHKGTDFNFRHCRILAFLVWSKSLKSSKRGSKLDKEKKRCGYCNGSPQFNLPCIACFLDSTKSYIVRSKHPSVYDCCWAVANNAHF